MPETEIHFSRFLLITPREMLSCSVATTSKSWDNRQESTNQKGKKVIIRRLLSSCYSKILFYILTDFAKAGAHCGRQSLLLSEPFPSILERWRTKIASISTKRTYQGRNAPMTSSLATSQTVSRLKKNRRKRGNDTPAMRKTSWAARFVSKYRH